jgi:hypothetical protein
MNAAMTLNKDTKAMLAVLAFSTALEEEITERLDIAHSEAGNEHVDRNDIIKEMMQDMDDRETVAHEFRGELRDYGIAIGVFEPHTREQLDKITTTGGRKYEFKRDGLFYLFKSWAPLDGTTE